MANSSNVTSDILGYPRIYDEGVTNIDRIDVGAYELQVSHAVCYIVEQTIL